MQFEGIVEYDVVLSLQEFCESSLLPYPFHNLPVSVHKQCTTKSTNYTKKKIKFIWSFKIHRCQVGLATIACKMQFLGQPVRLYCKEPVYLCIN